MKPSLFNMAGEALKDKESPHALAYAYRSGRLAMCKCGVHFNAGDMKHYTATELWFQHYMITTGNLQMIGTYLNTPDAA